MWVKILASGATISEDRKKGITWLKSPLSKLMSVQLVNTDKNGVQHKSAMLAGYSRYWHSRTAFANQYGGMLEALERIQAQLPSGKWLTITWNGTEYRKTVEDKAIGKPVKL
jgi:hypothetical protein